MYIGKTIYVTFKQYFTTKRYNNILTKLIHKKKISPLSYYFAYLFHIFDSYIKKYLLYQIILHIYFIFLR